MIADSVAFCREQGKRAIFDAEHFFDAYRDDSAYALECLAAAAGAGAENVTLCDTNGGSLPSFVAAATRGSSRHSARRPRSGSTPTTTPAAGSPTRWRRSSQGAPGAGLRQRLRRALRQRQPGLDPAHAAAEDGLRGRQPGAARRLTHDRPLPRRALQPLRRPRPRPTSAATPSPTRRDARCRGRRRRAAPSSTSTRPRSATSGTSSPPSSPARRRSAPRPSTPASSWTTRRPRGRSSS